MVLAHPGIRGNASDIRIASVKSNVRRVAKPALLVAAAAAVLVMVKLQPWADAPVESAPPRGQAVAATEKALRDSLAALTGALVKLTAPALKTENGAAATVTVRRVASAPPQANRDGDRTTEALVAPLPMTLLTPARLPAQPGATVILTATDPNWIPKPIPIQRRPFDVGQVPALGTRLPGFAPNGPVRTPPPEQPVFKPLFPKRPPTLNDGGPIDDCTVPCALRRGRDGTRRK